jgi:hypothetical protein
MVSSGVVFQQAESVERGGVTASGFRVSHRLESIGVSLLRIWEGPVTVYSLLSFTHSGVCPFSKQPEEST